MTEVATLFSSFEGFPFKHGGREVSIWSRDPLGGFSCKSFLATWLILLPWFVGCFWCFGGLKFLGN